MLKRLFDILFSTILIILFSPIILLVSVILFLKLGRPIFFKQERPGLHGKPFHIYKFRTMTNQRDEQGQLLPNNLRMTKLGFFLRKYSLDEIPQLFNVLKGELSFVGPRPLLMEYLPLYTSEQARRHTVKPGITGWAQVNGRNAISWEEKFNYDVWYVDNQSFWLDIKIILITVGKVFKSEGITPEGKVAVEKFRGSNFEKKDVRNAN
ncbi:sugar transferase [Halalkalibacterium halodurans]|uniref:sugar transferase n=1 Tax=Halalkalibacterium halodurans TaxID=86665 RepID=UPI002AA977A5|nr:sugar transferase [Halalkalibacterium halodurans]MDY7224216.1 sugar transferase [Halalkalibacterium halodurans]MDY7243501.1 sugar transferase [Halalkalibacterium halodurans]MED4123434.1 sugar transferase [Halalkalibacterium halodurans]